MRRPCQIIGALVVADGLFTATFSRGYVRSFWGSLRLGREYRNTVKAYASFPDTTLRIIGLAEVVIGATLLIPSRSSKEQMKEKTKERMQEVELEEGVSKEEFSRLLRGLADSIDKSSEFQTVLKGQRVSIPPQAKMKVEFEQKKKGGELELELKWKNIA